ncbi:AAA family ATPase [bacterium]|nr:AAA family ATPase [bacterium]
MQLDWDAAINSIRESLPQTQFQNWFSPVEFIRSNATSVVLGVPSRFHEDWLRNHYAEQIRRAIQNQCGSSLQLEFEIQIREENEQAAQAAIPKASTAPVVPERPPLRLITAEEKAPEPEALPEAPQIPPFHHPLFELPFNRVAYQCMGMFAESREMVFNPLVILGGVGMGKTHLLSELATKLHRRSPELRIRYTNAESFTYEYVQHIRSKDLLDFKKTYAERTDVLLFDDIHGLEKKSSTQEVLLHIFNEIVARGGRIAFTSAVSPGRLENFLEPLKSRLTSGVTAEIKPLAFEEKVELLNRFAAHNHIAIDGPVVRSLADKGQKDIRELMGTLLRVHLQCKLENRPLTGEFLAEESIGHDAPREAITMSEIVSLVEHHLGVPRSELVSKSRKGTTNWARQVAMYLARMATLLSLEEIGKTFDRDHATVIHAFEKVKETMATQPTRKYEVEFLKRKLQSRTPRPLGDNTDFPFT